MRRFFLVPLAFVAAAPLLGCAPGVTDPASVAWEDGDILFQVSRSGQAPAVALASGSPITHTGLVSVDERTGAVTVVEAVQPVREVPLATFLEHGSAWSAARLRPETAAALGPGWADKVLRVARKWKGLNYDARFEWSDSKIYCSELIWKAYARGVGLELVTPQRVGDLSLGNPVVQALIEKRTHGKGANLEEVIVTPGALADSPLLERFAGLPL
jgi:hypothetical protein